MVGLEYPVLVHCNSPMDTRARIILIFTPRILADFVVLGQGMLLQFYRLINSRNNFQESSPRVTSDERPSVGCSDLKSYFENLKQVVKSEQNPLKLDRSFSIFYAFL